jgi:hypothetical protein
MDSDQNEFEQLRRLLALKRHEQPPPGYFSDFSAQVVSGIKSGDRAHDENGWGSLLWEAPWMVRLLSAFQQKPYVSGAFGVAVCGLLICGMVYAESSPKPQPPGITRNSDSGAHIVSANGAPRPIPAISDSPPNWSTNGMMSDPGLETFLNGFPKAQTVDWRVPGRN